MNLQIEMSCQKPETPLLLALLLNTTVICYPTRASLAHEAEGASGSHSAASSQEQQFGASADSI